MTPTAASRSLATDPLWRQARNCLVEGQLVCFSNGRAYFGDARAYSCDLDALAMYFQDCLRPMAHWRWTMPGTVLDVSHAGLVREPDTTLREVFDFCGLRREPGCADIKRNAWPSATLGAAPVRSTLHAHAFGEWRRYEVPLSGLARALSIKPDSGTSCP